MNKIKLPLASRSEISFKMNIFGTQTVPSQVSLNLEKDKTILSFLAFLSGDEYVCIVSNLDKTFENQCEVKCTITVTLNGKVFTPFRGVAEIIDVSIPPVSDVLPEPEHVEVKQALPEPQIEPQVEPQVEPTPIKPVLTPPPIIVPPPVVAPKFEQKKEPAKPVAQTKPAAPISLLKNIEKPIERTVQEAKVTVKKTQPVKAKNEKIFEIKRVSVIYK